MTREFTPQERGKIKRLTKQRDYWRNRFEEVDTVLRKYPKLMSIYGLHPDVSLLKQSIRLLDTHIKSIEKSN